LNTEKTTRLNLFPKYKSSRYLLFAIVMLILFSGYSSAQKFKTFNISSNQLRKYGESALRAGDHYTAVKYFSQYASRKPDNADIVLLIAELHEKNREYDKAASNYLRAYHMDPDENKKAFYHYGVMTKMLGDYKKAADSLNEFIDIYRDEDDYREYRKYANTEIDGCNMALALIDDMLKKKVDVVLLDESINKAHVEMSPMYMNNDTIIYASLKTDRVEYFDIKDSASWPVRKFYMATRDGDNWKHYQEYDGPFNTEGVHTVNGTFSPDGKRFYFNQCYMYKVNRVKCDIYISDKVNNVWRAPEKLPEPVNLPDYTSTQPTIGISDKDDSEVIYFVSDRPETKGGTDIWYTVFDTVDNKFSSVRNMGRRINTERDEITPFMDNETGIFYFSSNGLTGLGGFDIYKTEQVNGKYDYAKNIGIPYNSSADDIYFVLHKNQYEGLFVSNRENELNVKNETCCDDIYTFNSSGNIRFLITGIVQDDPENILVKYNQNQVIRINRAIENVKKEKPQKLGGVVVYLYSIDRYTMESFYFLTDTTDEKGEFQFDLQSNKDFLLRVNEYGVFSDEHAFNTYNYAETNIRLDTSLIVVPNKPYLIENLVFEDTSTQLTTEIKARLDSSLLLIMNELPHIIIDISHHAPDRDADLSQARTQNIINYLIGKGISENRVYDNSYFAMSMLESEGIKDSLNKTLKEQSKGYL
jgi:tetratricopeptide (TPR) repeat protein